MLTRQSKRLKKMTTNCMICLEYTTDATNRCSTCHTGAICTPCYKRYIYTTPLLFIDDFTVKCPGCSLPNVIQNSPIGEQRYFNFCLKKVTSKDTEYITQVDSVLRKYPQLSGMKDYDQLTLMHLAAMHGNIGMMEVIQRHGGSMFSRDCDGRTPLHMLQDSAAEDEPEDEPEEPELISLAIDAGEYEYARELLREEPKPTAGILNTISRCGNEDFKMHVFNDPNIDVSKVNLPFMSVRICETILSRDDFDPGTQLHHLLMLNCIEKARVIINHPGVDFTLRHIGRTALEIASEKGLHELAELIRTKMIHLPVF